MNLFDQVIEKSLINLKEGIYDVSTTANTGNSVLPSPEEAFKSLRDDSQRDLVISALTAIKSKTQLSQQQADALKNFTLSTPSHTDTKLNPPAQTKQNSPSVTSTSVSTAPISTVVNPTNG